MLITADGAWRRGAVVPLKDNADAAVAECPSIEHVITVRRCGNEHAFTEGRDHWYHELVADQSTECPPEQMDAEDFLYLLYTSGTTGKPKGHRAHDRRLYDTGRDDPPDDLRHPRRRRVLVRGRLRVGHRPQLHRLRTARQPHDGRAVRGRSGLARQGPLVVDHREVPRHHPLHRADRDPLVHAVGDGAPRQARPVVAAAAGVGRRADQPRGVGLVLEGDRRRALPRRRHVVADRDRRDHDHAAAGVDHIEAGLRDVPVPGDRGRRRR